MGNGLASGQFLQPGQSLISPNDQYRLTMGQGGVAVLYQVGISICPLWSVPGVQLSSSSQSAYSFGSTAGATLQMTTGGDLALWPPGQTSGTSLWDAGTTNGGAGANVLTLQSDGNLVIESPSGAVPWESHSGTDGVRGEMLCTGSTLQIGQEIALPLPSTSAFSIYVIMQPDCNFVNYTTSAFVNLTSDMPDADIWASNTDEGDAQGSTPAAGQNPSSSYYGCYAVMQPDGNLVVYAPNNTSNTALWASGTNQSTSPVASPPVIGPYAAAITAPNTAGFVVLKPYASTVLGNPSLLTTTSRPVVVGRERRPDRQPGGLGGIVALPVHGSLRTEPHLVDLRGLRGVGRAVTPRPTTGWRPWALRVLPRTCVALATLVAVLATLGTAAHAAGSRAATVPSGPVTSCSSSSPNSLTNGQSIWSGACLVSPNHDYELIMQPDGNLVLYFESQADALWAAFPAGPTSTSYAGDTAVLYSSGDLCVEGWCNNVTAPNATLVLQNDGNLVVYADYTPTTSPPYAAWNTGTHGMRGDGMAQGTALQPGQYLQSPNKQFGLLMETNGLLMAYQTSSSASTCPMWTLPANTDPNLSPPQWNYPNTMSYPPYGSTDGSFSMEAGITLTPWTYLALQPDGNLVLYPPGGGPAPWATGTNGAGGAATTGASLQVQDDGNVVLYSSTGSALWQTATNLDRGTALCAGDTMTAGQYLAGTPALNNSIVEVPTSSGYDTATYQFGSAPPLDQGLVMQSDCNLVLYGSADAWTNEGSSAGVWWQSGTDEGDPQGSTPAAGQNPSSPYYGCYAELQPDGNLVVYAPNNTANTVLWSSGTAHSPTPINLDTSIGQYLLVVGDFYSTGYYDNYNYDYAGYFVAAAIVNDGGASQWSQGQFNSLVNQGVIYKLGTGSSSAGVLGDVPGWVADVLGIVAFFI